MSYNDRGFFISLFSMEDPSKNKVLELPDLAKTNKILEAFNHDYQYMAE
jgi:hypothetical protein